MLVGGIDVLHVAEVGDLPPVDHDLGHEQRLAHVGDRRMDIAVGVDPLERARVPLEGVQRLRMGMPGQGRRRVGPAVLEGLEPGWKGRGIVAETAGREEHHDHH